MTGPAIELHLDEDVDPLIGKLVQARGFYSFTTTQMAGMNEAEDAQQLSYAAEAGKTILTHNRRDFEALAREYFELGKTHFGIVIAVRRPPAQIARRVLGILNTTSREEMKNQLIYI